jgi:hypothetical protein
MGPESWIKIVEWAIAVGRRVPKVGPAMRLVRAQQSLATLHTLHTGVLHSMRRVTVMMGRAHWDPTNIAMLAVDLCTEFRKAMGALTFLSENELHCCLKMLQPPDEPQQEARLFTWARSKPVDDRPDRPDTAFVPPGSTIYAALTGGDDGATKWRRLSCFCSNDLPKHFDRFKCERAEWPKYYRSVLVFPLRYVRNPDTGDFDNIGFLAFDSPKSNAFAGMPEVFSYRDNPAEYQNRLDQSAAFHLGAIFADSLSAHLHGIYNTSTAQGAFHGQLHSEAGKEAPAERQDPGNLARRRPDAGGLPVKKSRSRQ